MKSTLEDNKQVTQFGAWGNDQEGKINLALKSSKDEINPMKISIILQSTRKSQEKNSATSLLAS